jgi:PAS domain S-box-containing protein
VALDSYGPVPLLAFDYGVWFWVHAVYAHLLLAAGVILVVLDLRRSTGLFRLQAITLLLGILPVWAANILYLTQAGPHPNLDWTPLAFGVTCAVYAWGLLRLRQLTLTPLAHRTLLEESSDGVVVVDLDNRIVDLNPAVEQVAGLPRTALAGQPLALVLGAHAQEVQAYKAGAWLPRELALANHDVHELQVSLLYGGDRQIVGKLVVLRDITEMKQREAQLRRQNEYLAALHQISLDLLQRRELNDLLQAVVESAAQMLDAPYGELMLVDGDELVVLACTADMSGLKGERITREVAQLSWQAYDTKQPAILEDYAAWPTRRAVYSVAAVHAVADYPIVVNETCVGVLALGRSEPGYHFEPDDVEKGIMFSQLAALVLDNAQLHVAAKHEIAERQHAERALQQHLAMEQLVGAIATQFLSLPSDQADRELQSAVAGIGEFAGVDRCYTLLLDEGGRLMGKAHAWCAADIAPFNAEHLEGDPLNQDSWVMGSLRHRGVVCVRQVADLPVEASAIGQMFVSQGIQSWLCMPVLSERGPLGLIALDSVRCERHWHDNDILLLRRAGEAIASALERWRAERAIQELNRSLELRVATSTMEVRRQASAMDAIAEGMAIVHEGHFAYVNPSYAALHGYSSTELVGKPSTPLYAVTDLAQLIREAEPQLQAQGRWTGVVAGRHKNGQSLDVELVLTVAGHDLIVSERDVTQRVAVERALRQAEMRYRNLFAQAPIMYLTTRNESGVPVISDCNEQLLTTLVYTRAELVGRSLGCIYTPRSVEQLACSYPRVLAGEVLDEERELLARDGRVLAAVLRATAEHNAAGEVTGSLSMYVDITARKQAEGQLLLLSEQLRSLAQNQANVREDERARIAREIHDELGQMLTALKMDVAWVNKRLPSDNPQLVAKLAAMSSLVSTTIKSVQRISAELRPNMLDSLGLAAAMEWYLKEFQTRTDLRCTLEFGVPKEFVLEPRLATALFRVYQEALTNVIRHASATTVSVALAQEEELLQLTVRDNGIGFDSARLNDPHSIGLIGMRERLHPWQGELKIHGLPGQGTTVRAAVPYRLLKQEVTV